MRRVPFAGEHFGDGEADAGCTAWVNGMSVDSFHGLERVIGVSEGGTCHEGCFARHCGGGRREGV